MKIDENQNECEVRTKTRHNIACAQHRAPTAWGQDKSRRVGWHRLQHKMKRSHGGAKMDWGGVEKAHTSAELDRESMPWVWGVDWQG